MARIKMTPEQYAEKQSRRLKANLEDVRAGVEAVSEAPGKKAAAKVQKWAAKLAEKATQDKWARNTAAVSLEDWKKDMLEKGVDRIPAGIDRAHDKVVAFAGKLFAHQEAGLSDLEKMPDLTLEDSIARATQWIRHMSKFRG
jgi:hypothetical protein